MGLGFERLGRLVTVCGVELLQIAGDARLNLSHAPLHLGPREVPVAIVHRLELTAVNRHAVRRQWLPEREGTKSLSYSLALN